MNRPGRKSTRAEYSNLRSKLQRRIRDSQRAGYDIRAGYKRLSDIETADELRRELEKMRRAWKSSKYTITWAQAEEEREIRRQSEREKQAVRAAERLMKRENLTLNEKNLLKGLAKYGITVRDKSDLAAWGAYISYRKSQQISSLKYEFDKWVEEIGETSRKARVTAQELLKDFALFTMEMRANIRRVDILKNKKVKVGSARIDEIFKNFKRGLGL